MKANPRIIVKPLAILVVGGIVFFSCKKDNNSSPGNSPDTDSTVSLSTSAATTDNMFSDTYDVLGQTTAGNNYLNARIATNGRADEVDTIPACATITVSPADTGTYPKTVTVNFGTGCTGWYGVTRSGSITFTFSGHLKNPGTTVTATYNNYKVNGYLVQGNYSVYNASSLSNGIMFTSTVTNGKVTYPNGFQWYSYSGTRTIRQTGGIGSPNYNTYVFSITGAHSYASWTGRTLTDSVTTPLVKQVSCENIVSGTVAFTYNGLIKGTLDYGGGNCDSTATITVGSFTKTIILPR